MAHALPTWAWRALSRQVVAQHGVSQLDEQSHARRRCVCARWRREHGSCCLSFDMAAMGDIVAECQQLLLVYIPSGADEDCILACHSLTHQHT